MFPQEQRNRRLPIIFVKGYNNISLVTLQQMRARTWRTLEVFELSDLFKTTLNFVLLFIEKSFERASKVYQF